MTQQEVSGSYNGKIYDDSKYLSSLLLPHLLHFAGVMAPGSDQT